GSITVKRTLRAAQNFDLLHVFHADRQGRKEALHGDVIEIGRYRAAIATQVIRRHLIQAQATNHQAGGVTWASIDDIKTGHAIRDAGNISYVLKIVDHADRACEVEQPLVAF